MRRLLTVFILILLIATIKSFSQNYADEPYDPRPSYGVFGNFYLNLHTANFEALDEEIYPSCCLGYESGSGIGLGPALLYSLPLTDQWELTIRAAYMNLSGKLTSDEKIGAVFNPSTNSSVEGKIEHSIDATLTSVALQPMASYRVSNQFRLHIGLRAGVMLDKSFEQKEEIVTPDYAAFLETGKRTRFEFSGEIPDASTVDIAGMAGASYDLPLNASYTLFLVPEAYLAYGITPIASDLTWNVLTITGGVGLRWAPREIIPVKPPPPPPAPAPLPEPPVPPRAPALDAAIEAVGVEDDGTETEVSVLRVEEFLYRRMHPVLNFVFFKENSAKIPGRYIRMSEQEKDDFSVRQLYDLKRMEVYHQVLNIVGKRMSFYPQARVTLVGCNSNQGPEKNNIELSRQRAEAVKNYLVNVWDIPEKRIETEARNLPELPSNPDDPDGIKENRRVEIRANIPQVFEPMIIRDTLRQSNPPHIRFKPEIYADIGVQSWKIITSQKNKNLRVFSGTGEPPKQIDWDMEQEDEQDYVPRFDQPLHYRLRIVDNDNKVWESPKQLMPVDQVTIQKKILEMREDKEIDRFSLIMFGFNQWTLGEDNQRIIDFAKKRIKDNSTVEILGYSDRVGDEQHNLELSRKRAYAAADALGVSTKHAQGLGERELLFNNDLPEGRFYSRTVTIEIITPIQ